VCSLCVRFSVCCFACGFATAGFTGWEGYTDPLPVSVEVDGQTSECRGACTFYYHSTHTPRIYSLAPEVVEEGTLITVNGRFHSKPFEFEVLRAPAVEIPLVSVKIANRAPESQRPENEPFGQSGTRCALFNQELEEPFGVGQVYEGGQEVRQFKCQVHGPRAAGRYNLSVALLGTAMEDYQMWLGEAQVQDTAYLTDHLGVSFMVHHLAKVQSVMPSSAGLLGGARVTILGNGFTLDKTLVRVSVGGDPCHVQLATMTRIECVLAPRGVTTDRNGSKFLPGALQPGARGVRRRVWWNRGTMDIETLRSSTYFNRPDVDEIEMSKFESAINLQWARSDAVGPQMQYTGFFRAPVSGNYSFMVAADDQATVWVGTRPNAAAPTERLIYWRSSVPSRSWEQGLWYKGRDHSPLEKVQRSAELRAARKVELAEGEFLYIDAQYRSGFGGDNFALAVVQHNSTVNRKDVPSAQDEKQLVDVAVPHTQLEVHKVTLKGASLAGTFRLSLGGKRSRPLAADASAAQVGAAVRELLSNCEGATGDATDSAGSTFECFIGRGLEYRGLARTTDQGDKCIPWVDTEYWDPWLVEVAGLESNLCRNPDYRASGPWCVNARKQARSCFVPRCGGTKAEVKSAPVYASFEDEEPNDSLPFTNTAEERNGVWPRIVKGNAFCGSGSLYFNNAWGMIRNFWRYDEGKDPAYEGRVKGLYPYGTSQFPYMCMAYRIPPTSLVSMLLLVGRRDVGIPGVIKGDGMWKTVYISNTDHWGFFPKIGSWGVIADDTWRYTCLNVQQMLDTAADQMGETTLFRGQNHIIWDIIFHGTPTPITPSGVPVGNYGSHEFWIDEFSISKTVREVKQTAYPQIVGRVSNSPLRLVRVENQTEGDERSWLIELSSEDCSPPTADFVLDVTALTGSLERAEVNQVQQHSERISANVTLGVGDKQVSFNPYSTAGQVQAVFAAAGAGGNRVKVVRTGVCQTGFGWLVTFTHAAGDLPLMTARLSEDQEATGASVRVYPYIDGGHVMGPISADYLHEAVTETNVQVIVDQAAAVCARDANNVSKCIFSYDDALTPSATGITAAKTATGTYQLTVTGRGFTSAVGSGSGAAVQVTLASSHACTLVSSNDTSVICQASFPFVAAGSLPVMVSVPGKGQARGDLAFDYQLEISGITPSSLNRNIVNTVTVSGAGFNPSLRSNVLSFGGTPCEPIKVSSRALECTLGPAASGTGRRKLLAPLNVQLILSGSTASASSSIVTSISDAVPTISSITPTKGAVGGGYTVTLSGSGFSSTLSDNTVLLGAAPCTMVEATVSSIKCTAGVGSIGSGAVTVVVSGTGISGVSAAPQFEYQLSVASISPSPAVFGFGGGNKITVSGTGFVSGASNNKFATPFVAVAGRQSIVIGVYTPTYSPEIHQLVLTANYVSEVQRISIPKTAYFELALFGRKTERLLNSVKQEVLQAALSKLMPAASPSVGVVFTAQGWQVEFPAELGNIDLLSASTCSSLTGGCHGSEITVTELVSGVSPRGTVRFLLGRYVNEWQEQHGNGSSNTSHMVNMSQVAWRSTLNVSITANLQQALAGHEYFGAIKVVKRRPSTQQVVWDITFLDLTGKRDVPDIDYSAVIGGNMTMRRVQQGIALPEGTFQLRLAGRASKRLSLNASATEVQSAVIEAFPDVLSASVFALDDKPGRMLDRSYPRQWLVKLERQGIAGASVDCCTNPLYVDWDPLACPSRAADLFLHHHPWYWPEALPRPTDLGEDAAKAELQAACDAEARALQLRPGLCQALVPLESLPVCGQGSGINPPCWSERFTSAKVRHADGQDVIYTRDDSMTSSATVKGYRFWVRADLKTLIEAQTLTVNHSVAYPSGVHATPVYVKAEQTVSCTASDVTNTSLTAIVSPLSAYGHTVAEMIQSDYMLKPLHHLSFSRQDPLISASGVFVESGRSLNGDVAHLDASVPLPVSNMDKFTKSHSFTVEIWTNRNATAAAPLLQNVGTDGFSGFALVLSSAGTWHFYLAAGCDGADTGVEMPVTGFSVVTARAAPNGSWSHIALTFDGAVQSIFVDGQLMGTSYVPGPYRPNAGGHLVFGGPCMVWMGSHGCNQSGVHFVVDEALFYDVLVPAAALAAHASLLEQTTHAVLKVKSHGVLSSCADAFCALQIKVSSTARVGAVEPARGYAGANLTIFGESFSKSTVESVSLAGGSCDSIIVHSDSQLTCIARGPGSGIGPVRVVLRNLGASLSSASFEWITVITSITPAQGSLLGGTRITISGVGMVTDLNKLSVTFGSHPCVVQTSSDGMIECFLSELTRPSSTSSRMLPLVLAVEGKVSVCQVGAGCGITLSLAATPAIHSLRLAEAMQQTEIAATEGSTLVFAGNALPTEGDVFVRVGESSCAVNRRNDTHVACVLARGVGGYHKVRVLYAAGYAADFVSQCCAAIMYQVSVSAVLPSMGGPWGGQLVTVTGSGFDAQTDSALASATRVFVGQRRARVQSASYSQLVFETPALADRPAIGLEYERVWKKIRHCGIPGQSGEECVGQGLRDCAQNRSWGTVADADPGLPPIEANNMILAIPGSDSRSSDAALVDGDLETVWWSKPDSNSLKLVVDLGPQHVVVQKLMIHWAGRAAAAEYRISAGAIRPSTCAADLEEVVGWTATSMAPWNRTGTALASTVASWQIQGTGSPWDGVNWKSAKGDILFRFTSRAADKLMVMNSLTSQGQWYVENRIPYDTGTSQQTWTVTVDDIGFHVLLGGQEMFVYEHRLPWSSFDKVHTEGTVSVVYNEVKVADQVEEIDIGALPFTPLVFMIELRGLRADIPSFGIRNLVFLDTLALPFPSSQPLLLQVGGADVVCSAGNLSVCSFNYYPAPEVKHVSPSNGTAGSIIMVNATGLNLDDCAANKVMIASGECVMQSCGGTRTNTSSNAQMPASSGWIRCAVSGVEAGTYKLELTVDGVAALSSKTFTYPVSITSVTPVAAGYGGGYTVTVIGDGFSTNAARMKASFCDFPCRVTKADTTSLECVTGAFFDSAQTPGRETLDISIVDGGDDATEDVMAGAIVVSGGVLAPYLMPHGHEWSRRVIYLRFSTVDVAQGMQVARARLQIHAADAQCRKGSQMRIWVEASDHSQLFLPSESGSLGARTRSSLHHDWIMEERWRWMAEAQESSDMSHLVNQVLARPGWRAGNAITFILQQRTNSWYGLPENSYGLPENSCNLLSADFSGKYAPKLRLKLANSTKPRTLAAERTCALAVTVEGAAGALAPGLNYARACGPSKDQPCPASQSSTSYGGIAERAVDNAGQSGLFSSSSCTHTGSIPAGEKQWWRVDMQQSVLVTALTIVGRADCCEDRTQGYSIFVGNRESAEQNSACVINQTHLPAGRAQDITCRSPVRGRYVYFILPPGQSLALCEVHVLGLDPLPSSDCAARASITAKASSSDVPERPSPQADLGYGYEDPNLYRQVVKKKRSTLTYEEARTMCASIGSRLCRKDKELLMNGVGGVLQPFFVKPIDVDPNFPMMVPFEGLWLPPAGVEASHRNQWLQVSGNNVGAEAWYPHWDFFSLLSDAQFTENEKRTRLIPCCGVTGHPAYMAVDDSRDSFWDSGVTGTANLTLTVVSADVASLQSIDIMWTEDYAREYLVLASHDNRSWFQVAQNLFGDGSLDSLSLGHGQCDGISAVCLCDAGRDAAACNLTSTLASMHNLQLKIHMLRPRRYGIRYGIRDVAVRGCDRAKTPALAADAAALFTARLSLTPEVTSVVPERGSTAGDSDVTVTGRFFSTDQSKISVSLGRFGCAVTSITSLSANQQIVCKSSASGILHGGRKFVSVAINGHGTTVASEAATFWYVDTWSARTTWGGSAPPTGCGSWADDKLCTDTVHIPAGQVVLLDQSLPRFYLLLIEGTLIFDRRDISLSANYILLRGGTLQVGTEAQPFTHKVHLTLHGNPKSMELPTFGSKVIACYECTMDIHGAPQVAWTKLATTVMPGATEIIVQDPVAWPVDSKIVIATTDFESPRSSHSEVATVAAVLDDGKRVQLKDIRVCPEYGFSGMPVTCQHRQSLSFPHLGEVKKFDGRPVEFRAEVGLLSRNIVIEGDHDETLCPQFDMADDGVTKLSCNQFGGQIFFHSPGHESLVARISNFEIRNGGQAFRLGRYSIHWHMVGNMRDSYQRNVSIHHAWNR
jgi:hypothetical protein